MTRAAPEPAPTPEAVTEPVLVVAAAVVDDLVRPARLLSARRYRPATLAGRWEFPGGEVDLGETPEQALHRELREELGIGVRLGDEVRPPEGDAWVISARYRMRLWFAEITDGRPEPLVEHDELRWLEAGRWHDVAWLDPDVPIVTELVRVAALSPGR